MNALARELRSLFDHFGRSQQEADVYLASLSLGPSGVSQIAAHTGLGRTNCYFYVKKLAEDGLLLESRKGSRPTFTAIQPRDFVNVIRGWTSRFQSLLPQLESLRSAEVERPTITISESSEGHAKIYEEIGALPKDDFFRVLQGRQSLEEELRVIDKDALTRFFQNLIERNITTRGIFTDACLSVPAALISPENLEGMRCRPSDIVTLPESILALQQVMFVYGDTAAFLFPETRLVMTIRHGGIARTLGSVFDALHQFGKKTSPAW